MDFLKDLKLDKVDSAAVERRLAEEEAKERRRTLEKANELADIPLRFRNASAEGCTNGKLAAEVKEFALRKENDKVLVITGPVGTGKTTLLCAAVHERALGRMSCGLYMSDRVLSQMIQATKSFTAKESEFEFYKRIAEVPFLCIDEVGASEDSDLETRFLRTILALRYDNMLPTMIATNLTMPLFKKFIAQGGEEDSVLDRLYSIIIPRVLGGESRRARN